MMRSAMKEPPLLVDALPEIAIGLERLLRRKGLDELAATVPGLRVHANEGALYFVPPRQVKRPPQGPHAPVNDPSRWSFMYHPNRRRYWLGTMPRKRWSLVVEVIPARRFRGSSSLWPSYPQSLGPDAVAVGVAAWGRFNRRKTSLGCRSPRSSSGAAAATSVGSAGWSLTLF
jgi:hypothetical protein